MTESSALKAIKNAHRVIQSYLFITELAFFFGPWEWEINNESSLIFFLTAIHVAIFLAYLGARTKISRQQKIGVSYNQHFSNINFIKLTILVTLLLCIPTSLSRTGALIPDLMAGLENLGAAYNDNFARIRRGNAFGFVEYIRILLSPFIIGLVGLTAFFWRDINIKWRTMAIFAIAFNTAIYIATGTNKGIADLVIITPIMIHLSLYSRNPNHNFIWNKINLISLASFIVFLIFFGQTQELRSGNVGVDGIFNTGTYIIKADPNALPQWAGDQWLLVYQSLTRYVTQGYQALSLAMEFSHNSTYGIGNSVFLSENVDSIFDTKYFSENNLPALIETKFGWSRFYLWHTAYVWFISDFGYLGTVMLVGLFAYILFLNLERLLVDPNAISLVIVQQMVILFLYLPANNQIFQNGEGLIGTLSVLVIAVTYNRKNLNAYSGLER